ncbi:hypothetical protein T265_03973 [Opisthorchis viverrini]|uniref:Uncharacterized protein n=1 Tax=Opisthorchis viverrini TaxID=6198 RepID=A0A075AH65_OPIVI|nr:hypothetical protein T265_03973 [Opisthorchis viverrini]KER29404.1 hypothetical protein T265_03973 [Opisthorchis viverrini]
MTFVTSCGPGVSLKFRATPANTHRVHIPVVAKCTGLSCDRKRYRAKVRTNHATNVSIMSAADFTCTKMNSRARLCIATMRADALLTELSQTT